MKITADDRFWIVLDPTPVSVIEDVLVGCNLHELELMIMGNAAVQKRMTDRNLTIHTVEISAREDANKRLLTIGVINSRLTQ